MRFEDRRILLACLVRIKKLTNKEGILIELDFIAKLLCYESIRYKNRFKRANRNRLAIWRDNIINEKLKFLYLK